MNPLLLAARHGPYVLIMGLLAGLFIAPLGHALQPYLAHMVVVLLFVSVLRMEPKSILGSLAELPRVTGAVLLLQLAVPLVVLAIGAMGGWLGTPVLLSLLIMGSAPSITGSPNICMMMGHQPQDAMRLMVVGTCLLPLTVLPVFWMMPELGGVGAVLWAALRLFVTISLTTLAAVATRLIFLRAPSDHMVTQLEGASALTLAIFVIGLMPAVSKVALDDPVRVVWWVGFACLANFGAQVLMHRVTKSRLSPSASTALSVIAGNRNVALFFLSLPVEVTAPIMIFIGCYQIPMYLTPLLMRRLYRETPQG